jgi:signal transduction histidine kinase
MSTPNEPGIREAEELIARLHATAETDKALLARTIHDELGGLMMSAMMDLSSVKHSALLADSRARGHVDRATQALEKAIDLSRKIVEELRPSILDNFGLFQALRWQLKRASRDSDAVCIEVYPEMEPQFEPPALIALFRLAEEALAMMFKRESVKAAQLHVELEDGEMCIRFIDDGIPVMSNERKREAATSLTSIQHRIRVLGGKVDTGRTSGGGTVLTARIPLPSTAS